MKKAFLTVPLVVVVFFASLKSAVAQRGGHVAVGGFHGGRNFHAGGFYGAGARFSPGVGSFHIGFHGGVNIGWHGGLHGHAGRSGG